MLKREGKDCWNQISDSKPARQATYSLLTQFSIVFNANGFPGTIYLHKLWQTTAMPNLFSSMAYKSEKGGIVYVLRSSISWQDNPPNCVHLWYHHGTHGQEYSKQYNMSLWQHNSMAGLKSAFYHQLGESMTSRKTKSLKYRISWLKPHLSSIWEWICHCTKN